MAWNDANYFTALGLLIEFNNQRVDGIINSGGFGATGSVNETPVTQINSTFQEFVKGITDGGVMQVSANAPLQSDVYETLRKSNTEKGSPLPLNVFIGGVPTNYKNVDRFGFEVNGGVHIVSADTSDDAAHRIVVRTGDVARGISVGDFLRPGSDTDNANAVRIEGLLPVSDGLQITYATGGNETAFQAATDIADGGKVDIVRPAIKIAQSGYVAQMEHQGETDGIIQLALAFRKSGASTHWVGARANGELNGRTDSPDLPSTEGPQDDAL